MYIMNRIKVAAILTVMLLSWTVYPAIAANIVSEPVPTLVPTTGGEELHKDVELIMFD